MLPRSTTSRIQRKASQKGRALEISRLIGRSLRSAIDLNALGERSIVIDCDVIQADGGTRTAAICGGYVALYDALQSLIQQGELDSNPLISECAAISVGIIAGEPRLDLCYEEDSVADVDMNVVMLANGNLVEVQGSAEGAAFPRASLDAMLDLATAGIQQIIIAQREVLGLE